MRHLYIHFWGVGISAQGAHISRRHENGARKFPLQLIRFTCSTDSVGYFFTPYLSRNRFTAIGENLPPVEVINP